MATVAQIQARITQIDDVDLPGVRAAIKSLISGGHAMYDLDTGQTRQEVRRLSLKELRAYELSLVNELERLRNSLGSVATIGEPVW